MILYTDTYFVTPWYTLIGYPESYIFLTEEPITLFSETNNDYSLEA